MHERETTAAVSALLRETAGTLLRAGWECVERLSCGEGQEGGEG